MGGKFLPKLNTSRKPIAYKYREGNVKRTLKRELKVFETVSDQAIEFIDFLSLMSICIHIHSFQCSFTTQGKYKCVYFLYMMDRNYSDSILDFIYLE
jgi:hypothetical protein